MLGNATFQVHLGLLMCEIRHASVELFLFSFVLHFFLRNMSIKP